MQGSNSKKILKLLNFLPKSPFSFTLKTIVKVGKETNKWNIEIIYTRVTKHASKKVSKAKVNLNWLWKIDCFDCIFISRDNLACLVPMSMFLLGSWCLYFLQHLLQVCVEHKT